MSSRIPQSFFMYHREGTPASTVSIGGRLYPWRASDWTQIGGLKNTMECVLGDTGSTQGRRLYQCNPLQCAFMFQQGINSFICNIVLNNYHPTWIIYFCEK